jgi:adenosyl cobinamide kinase/adenosyl cobinamide phosphate guanylyltransferase
MASPGLTVLTGGARSGKSDLAVKLGQRHAGPVAFVATAPNSDASLADRIARHRADRPSQWRVEETPVAVAEAVSRHHDALVIVDCLTLWVSNLMWEGHGAVEILRATERLVAIVQNRAEPTVIVTNEVGMGVHPETTLGMDYRDQLGAVNKLVVAAADTAVLLIAGRPVVLQNADLL